MTDEEKVTYCLAKLAGDAEATSTLLTAYLSDAKALILNRRFPQGFSAEAVMPSQYDILQCQIAIALYEKRGAEGELTHNENGVSRTYESTTAEELLKYVTPIAWIR